MSPEVAAGLTGFVGLCLLAGWVTGFRHRSYVGWLGLAFFALAGFLLALGRVRAAEEIGGSDPRMELAVKGLLFVWVGALVLAAGTAVVETRRRFRELREGHQEAAEALLELMQASREREKAKSEGEVPGGAEPPEDDSTS